MEISLRNLHTAFSYALSWREAWLFERLVFVLVEEEQGVLSFR